MPPPAVRRIHQAQDLTGYTKGLSSDLQTMDTVRGLGRQCASYRCDLSDRASVAQLIPRIIADHRIDVLVNAAGILKRHDAVDYPQGEFDEVMQVNLSATFVLCRELAKYWIENEMKGKIINIGSVMTIVGGVRVSAYAASKGAVGQLTKALSNEWAGKGICVNAIAPGARPPLCILGKLTLVCFDSNIATDMNKDVRADKESPYYQSTVQRIPAGHWGTPENLKGPVVFLASSASNYVSGEILKVWASLTPFSPREGVHSMVV
ncbi:hypothetical protein LOZ36_003299 [Ophidiomyces ophidiicola]|nr:hypothetical protein LOZ36_003299 [Ophidiomyces ophidiicola]